MNLGADLFSLSDPRAHKYAKPLPKAASWKMADELLVAVLSSSPAGSAGLAGDGSCQQPFHSSFSPPSHLLGAAYLVLTYVMFAARFILAFHYSAHRRLFSQEYNILNQWTEWVLAPVFGIPCGTYTTHHCVMHHREDNGEWDLSSTEPYQRDNFLHFLVYWLRHAILIHVELPMYCVRRKRWDLLAKLVFGMVLYFYAIGKLRAYAPVQTLWICIIPYIFTSFVLMFGNWSQHIFVDPTKPESDYTLTYNCVAHVDNQQTFNDGYHSIHHLNSRTHWSEMPKKFMETMDKHAAEDALVFKGIGFFEIGAACMLGKLGWLADHVVSCSETPKARDELISLMKQRLVPVKRAPKKSE
eukprot:jgi/Tetstr1/445598/TSEL_003404.t1